MSSRIVESLKRTVASKKSSSPFVRQSQGAAIANKSQNANKLGQGVKSAPLASPMAQSVPEASESIKKAYETSRKTIKSSVELAGRVGCGK